MAKTKISEFSATPANNTDIDSIFIGEGMAPSNVNDAIRELMAQLKDFQTGAQGDSFGGPINGTIGATTPNTGAFTTLSATGNVTLGDASTDTLNVGNGGIIKDSYGNVGIGVTPNASWLSSHEVMQFGSLGALWGVSSGAGSVFVSSNAYSDTINNYKYLITSQATYYAQSAGSHLWFNAPSGTAGNAISFTEAMRLDANGNLGLGVTPSAWGSVFKSLESSYGGSLTFYANGNFPSTWLSSNAYNNGTNWISKVTDQAGLYTIQGTTGKHIWSTVASDVTAGNTITFTDAMTLNSSGDLLVATTGGLSGGGRVQVLGAATTTAMAVQVGTNGYPAINFLNASSTQQGYIQTNASTVLYVSVSDYRLKNTVAPMTGALAKVALLKPCTYKWNATGSNGQGFIAHELAEVCPDAVTGEKDAVDAEGNPKYQGIDTSFLVATLTAAIQELNAKFEAYKASHP